MKRYYFITVEIEKEFIEFKPFYTNKTKKKYTIKNCSFSVKHESVHSNVDAFTATLKSIA